MLNDPNVTLLLAGPVAPWYKVPKNVPVAFVALILVIAIVKVLPFKACEK